MTPLDSKATPPAPDETARPMLRHTLATLAYRGGKAARDAPEGFAEHVVQPEAAFWLADLGEFVLPYEAVRTSDDPDATLTAFLESTSDDG